MEENRICYPVKQVAPPVYTSSRNTTWIGPIGPVRVAFTPAWLLAIGLLMLNAILILKMKDPFSKNV